MTTLILGTQFGDEGKGKIVDIIGQEYDQVVRFQGGNNAGHTIYYGGEKYVLHAIPSGVFSPTVEGIIAQGVVIQLASLREEIEEIERKIKRSIFLKISDKAKLVLPYHPLLEKKKEKALFIGTTNKGIGPAYEDFYGRFGLSLGDLYSLSEEEILVKIRGNLSLKQDLLKEETPREEDVLQYLNQHKEFFRPYVVDTQEYLMQSMQQKKNILFEGAQGALLDIYQGTYPYVTSSSPSLAGLAQGTGISPLKIETRIGVMKAYTTRVGEGPFPTEDDSTEIGEVLATEGKEFGSTTGRKRRCGWLDLHMLKKVVDYNGLQAIILTKIDILAHLPYVKIATGRRGTEIEYQSFPRMEFFSPDAPKAWENLPKSWLDFIQCIQDTLGIPVIAVSTGVHKEDMVYHSDYSLFFVNKK